MGWLPAVSAFFLHLFVLVSRSSQSNQTLICCLWVPEFTHLPGPVIHEDLNYIGPCPLTYILIELYLPQKENYRYKLMPTGVDDTNHSSNCGKGPTVWFQVFMKGNRYKINEPNRINHKVVSVARTLSLQ